MYIKKLDKIYLLEDIGSLTLIPTEVIDEKTGLPIMEEKENPIYVIKETYKEKEFMPNLLKDLNDLKEKMDGAVERYNTKLVEITQIKEDLKIE